MVRKLMNRCVQLLLNRCVRFSSDLIIYVITLFIFFRKGGMGPIERHDYELVSWIRENQSLRAHLFF